MTRKDYILIAQVLRGQRPYISRSDIKDKTDQLICDVWDLVVKDMADALAQGNPKFNHQQFVEACGLMGTVVKRDGSHYESNQSQRANAPKTAMFTGMHGLYYVFCDETGLTHHLTGHQVSESIRALLTPLHGGRVGNKDLQVPPGPGLKVTLTYRATGMTGGWYAS